MMLRNTDENYGLVSQALHWAIVFLVFTQLVLGPYATDLPLGLQRLIWLSRHKSIGMTVLLLMILRLAWRMINRVPPLPPQMPGYERKLALVTHWLFYALLLCLPVSGWIYSSASNLTVSWFGIFNWPNLVTPDQGVASATEEIHEVLAWSLLALIVLHVGAALRHQFILKDGILARMLPGFVKSERSGKTR